MKARRLLSSPPMLVRRPSSMRRATWAPLGGTWARLRRLAGRLSTLALTSFAVGETGALESNAIRAWVGVGPSCWEKAVMPGRARAKSVRVRMRFVIWRRTFLLLIRRGRVLPRCGIETASYRKKTGFRGLENAFRLNTRWGILMRGRMTVVLPRWCFAQSDW